MAKMPVASACASSPKNGDHEKEAVIADAAVHA